MDELPEERSAREKAAKQRVAAFRNELRQRVAAFRQLRPLDPHPVALCNAHILLAHDQIEEALLQGVLEMCRPPWSLAFPPHTTSDEFLIPGIGDTRVLAYLRSMVLGELQCGTLTGSGLPPNVVTTAKRTTYAPDRWRIIDLDWDNDRATCEGSVVAVGITVERKPVIASSAPLHKASPAGLRRWWHHEYVPTCQIQPTRIECEKAARDKFPGGFDRKLLRKLRTDQGWSKHTGPRRKKLAMKNGV